MIGLLLASALLAPAASNPPIEVPPEITPAWAAYTHCVRDHFRQRMLSVHSLEVARRAWSASVGDCRDVRTEQLALALATRVDRRIYGDREDARALVRLAFDRFDAEFNVEWNDGPPRPAADAPEDQ